MAKRKTRFKKIYVLDTNIILNEADNIFTLSDSGQNLIVLPETVLDELDTFKSGLSEISYQAREFGRIYNDAELLQVDRASNKKLTTIHSKSYKDGRIAFIDVISKKKYDSDNDNSIDPKIKNDRKIIEIARDIQTEHSNVVFISLDIMAKNRALSIGLDVQGIKTDQKENLVLSYNLQLENPKKEYNIFDIYSMDVPKTVQHLEITSQDGKPYYYYKTGSLFVLIDEIAIKKQEVPPVNMGQKVLMSQMLDEYYDVVLSDSPAGCVLPGTSIKVQFIEKYVDEMYIENIIGISRKKQRDLRAKKIVRFEKITNKKFKYNLGDFSTEILNYCKLSGSELNIYANDKKYNSKYLKLRYWLKFLTKEEALVKLKYLRPRYVRYFDYDLNEFVKLGYNPNNIHKHIFVLQNRILNEKDLIIPFSNRDINFWLWRGYSEQEAKEKVSQIQSELSCRRFDKYTKQDMREQSVRCKEFYIKKGYSEQEAQHKVKEQQTTFSLDICVQKHGEKLGYEIWKDRQERWQNTLNTKPQEEIDRINKSKGTIANSKKPLPGYYNFELFRNDSDLANTKGFIYYIKFINDDKIIHKIGITKNLQRRISKFRKVELLWFEENTLLKCFTKEQYILTKYDKYRITIPGISTELFSTDIRGIIND